MESNALYWWILCQALSLAAKKKVLGSQLDDTIVSFSILMFGYSPKWFRRLFPSTAFPISTTVIIIVVVSTSCLYVFHGFYQYLLSRIRQYWRGQCEMGTRGDTQTTMVSKSPISTNTGSILYITFPCHLDPLSLPGGLQPRPFSLGWLSSDLHLDANLFGTNRHNRNQGDHKDRVVIDPICVACCVGKFMGKLRLERRPGRGLSFHVEEIRTPHGRSSWTFILLLRLHDHPQKERYLHLAHFNTTFSSNRIYKRPQQK